MAFELWCLAWTLVLALGQIMAAGQAKSVQYGYRWGTGPRDETLPPLGLVTGRLQRAQDNLLETLPLFVGAVLIAVVAQRTGPLTWWGCLLYLLGRIAFVPLYLAGVRVLRSIVWGIATAGLVLILLAILLG